jgi:hypothetical protein
MSPEAQRHPSPQVLRMKKLSRDFTWRLFVSVFLPSSGATRMAEPPVRSKRSRRSRGAACESPCRTIHPEIPLCGIEGLCPSLPRCQPVRTVGNISRTALPCN